MADELSLLIRFSFAKGDVEIPERELTGTFDVTGTKVLHTKQTVGTTAEAIEVGDIATPGVCLAINRDTTNYVTIKSATGADDAEAVIKLMPGEPNLFRFNTTAPFWKANSSACEVEYWLVEA